MAVSKVTENVITDSKQEPVVINKRNPWQRLAKGAYRNGVPLLVILLIWWLMTLSGKFSSIVLPPPQDVASAALEKILNLELFKHTLASMQRVIFAFAVSTTVGIFMALGLVYSRPIKFFFEPLLSVLQPIPGLAWIPLAIMWFGLTPTATLFIMCIAVFFPVVINTRAGIANIDRNLIRAAKILGASQRMMIMEVVFPASLPYFMSGIRIGAGYGWRALVAGEMITSSNGLGFMIFNARSYLRSDLVIVGMLTIGLLWFCIDGLILRRIESKTIERWSTSEK